MALHGDPHPAGAAILYRIQGGSLTGTSATIGVLPADHEILRVVTKTHVAGTGSSAPTISLGIAGTAGKYVNGNTLVVTATVDAYTVVGTALKTAAETLVLTYGNSLPTNATYDATLVVELVRING